MIPNTVTFVAAALASVPNVPAPTGQDDIGIPSYTTPAMSEELSGVQHCKPMESVASSAATVGQFFAEPPLAWNADHQRRFEKLLTKRISRQLSGEDAFEYEQLKRWRRDLLSPRSIDDMLREREEAEVSNELIAALRKYVHFIERTH